jgi:hypothetical protein
MTNSPSGAGLHFSVKMHPVGTRKCPTPPDSGSDKPGLAPESSAILLSPRPGNDIVSRRINVG